MRKLNKNFGFTIIAATFILVVMSLTAQFLVNIITNYSTGANMLVQGQNTYFAARSGWEWCAVFARINSKCPNANPTTFTINQGSLLGFRVQVSCTKVGSVYTITSVATYKTFGQFGYSTRTYSRNYP